ncbi:MAG TPA: adenylate/guanylate cyclase domain-containing protein [Puia sp.]|nr:adenylate/guanylate cyclase domain-containing protein [Puia sp.]
MAKILVVDDEPDLEVLIKQRFRKQIRDKQYEFAFAINGLEALDKIRETEDLDVVLSDINMPEMDGLTLLDKIGPLNPIIKAVIVSAYGDMDNIRVAMNRGAFDFVTKPVNFEDLDLTIMKTLRHVTQTRQTLKAIRENNILRMYVDETVLNFMNRPEFESALLKNETIEASVAFIDICGFTSITETEQPNVVVNMLNNYFDTIVKEIIAQNGYVDKFIGDAVLAIFRNEYHLDRAVDACLAVRNQIEKIIPDPNGLGFRPKVSIGIHSGEMISGNIGSASLRRLDYTVIGDTVNTAERLHQVAEEGQIIITQSSFEKIQQSFHCNKLKEVQLKHKAHPVQIYEVVS